MFWRRNDPQIFRIIPLQPGYEGHPHAPRKKGIFPVGLLAPSPTWIAEDVDIRGPEIQPLHNVPPSGAHRLVMFRSSLRTDHDRHVMDQRVVKRGRQSNRLRKDCCGPGIGYPMYGFAPPVVSRHLKSGDSTLL